MVESFAEFLKKNKSRYTKGKGNFPEDISAVVKDLNKRNKSEWDD